MVNNVDYVSIRHILDRVMRHPLLSDISLEAAVQYAVDFIGIMGLPNILMDKIETIEIKEYRGVLPCGLVSIHQVRESKSGLPLIAMSDNFNGISTGGTDNPNRVNSAGNTFKTQGRIIHSSIKSGSVDISFTQMLLDEDGFPLIPDNSIFLKALETYIKKEWFTILFDLSKISQQVLHNTQQEYAFLAGQCHNEFIIPSVSEMEAITNNLNQLIMRTNVFDTGFKHLGTKERFNKH